MCPGLVVALLYVMILDFQVVHDLLLRAELPEGEVLEGTYQLIGNPVEPGEMDQFIPTYGVVETSQEGAHCPVIEIDRH